MLRAAAHHLGEQGERVGVQSQLRLVQHDDRRQPLRGLEEERGQADEPQRPVGEGVRAEQHIRTAFLPFEADFVLIERGGTQDEIAEERGRHPHGLDDVAVSGRLRLAQEVEVSRQVRGVRP